MDLTIILAITSALIVLLLSFLFIFKSQKPIAQNANNRQRAAAQQGGASRVQAARNQRARMRATAARTQTTVAEEEGEDVEVAEEGTAQRPSADFDDKMGAKKRAKLEAKAERKLAREAEEQLREEKKIRDAAQEEERKKKDELREAEEKKHEEEEKKAIEEKEKKELEEYLAMKAAFTVEGEGYEENEQEDNEENLLKSFLDYIKAQKVVVLEDLAAHFKLKTQATIDRITELQASGDLTGVVDDRGKFIYISQDELEQVAKFIKQRGRVSITDLAESSNNLINLNPVTAS